MSDELIALRRFGPLLVSFWGWALLAVAGAHGVLGVGAAAVGLLAALAQVRAFATSAVVEGAALCAAIALAPGDKLGFTALGAAFVLAARVVSRVARPPS